MAAPDSHSPPPAHQLRLTTALQRVLEQTNLETAGQNAKPLTLGLIVETTGERAFGVLMAFLCLPFLTPIPLPGLSIAFGLALLLLGAQFAIRKHRPWLPQRLLNRRLPPKISTGILRFVARLFRPLERVIGPRLLFMQNPVPMVAVGVALAADGFLLSLPLPPIVPLSNAIPAWMALIKILGITEEDGLSLILGTALTAAAIAAIVILLVMGYHKIT